MKFRMSLLSSAKSISSFSPFNQKTLPGGRSSRISAAAALGALCFCLILLALPVAAQTPAVTLTGSATFPQTAVGASAAAQNISLQLNAAQTISSITAAASQGGAHEFTVGTVSGCAVNGTTSNASGSVCTVPVTFSPSFPGLRSVPLTVTTSAGTFHFGLNGIGGGPQAVLLPGTISTVPGTALNIPLAVALDSAANLYIADTLNNRVLKMDATFNLTVVAGNGTAGYLGDGGPAASAELNQPEGVAVDGAGNVYIAEWKNGVIRKVDANTGNISTVAGKGTLNYSGDGGPATSAELSFTSGVAVDISGNIYIADKGNNVVRKVDATTGVITTIAGNGTLDFTNNGVPASNSLLNAPYSVSVDRAGNVYLSDSGNNIIRKIDASTGNISTIAGNGTAGYAGDGGPATSAKLNDSKDLALDAAGNLYIADFGNNVIRKVDAASGVITTVAGNGFGASKNPPGVGFSGGYSGDGGPATAAELNGALGVAVDGTGTLYIADSDNSFIRIVTASAAALNFATPTDIGTTDAVDGAKIVTVSNIGNAPLLFQPFTTANLSNAVLTGASSADCAGLSPLQLAAGAVCTLSIEFAPTAVGPLTGFVNMVDNALNAASATQPIPLSGTGVQQVLASFTVTAPATATKGTPLSITVTANDAGTNIVTGYTGTVHFTSTDGSALLPADYAFTAGDHGVHVFSVTLNSAGNQTVTVKDLASAATGTSAAVAVSVPPPPSTTAALTSSAASDYFGQTLTFTAKLTSAAGTPDGSVSFYDGATLLGASTLSAGTATYSTAALTVGTHSITAAYAGSTNFAAVTSAAQSVTVNAAVVTLPATGSAGTVTLNQGGSGTAQLTVGSLGTLSGTVALTCSGLPAGLACSLSPASIAPASLPAPVTITVNSSKVSSAAAGQKRGFGRLGWALAMMLPGVLLMRGNRRFRIAMMATALGLLLLLGLAACGGGSGSSATPNQGMTPVGNYSGTITATPAGGTAATTSFNVVLQ